MKNHAVKVWLIRRPDHRYLELVDGHWGWTSNAVSALQYPTEQEARAAMKAAKSCGVDWPGWHPFQAEFRPLNLP